MWNDPIVEEIRKIRFTIEEECHGNSNEILRRAIAIQENYPNRLISKPKSFAEKPLISANKLAFLKANLFKGTHSSFSSAKDDKNDLASSVYPALSSA